MGNDYAARKQRRKESKRQRDDEAPKRIRKKKQPRRICRGECYKAPLLDLDSSDEDMIATSRSRRRASLAEDGATHVAETEEEQVLAEEVPFTKKRKLSTSSKLIIPKIIGSSKKSKRVGSDGGDVVTDKHHPVIGAFLRQENIESPLPLQKKCWPAVLRGDNVYVIAQPGSGKTLSYLLPIACMLVDLGHSMTTRPLGPLALVLLPTRELAQQVAAVCRKIKKHCGVLRVSCLTGGSEKGKQFDSLKRKPHIVVATPGRCVDMLEDGAFSLGNIEHVILDEADKMLSLGFADQLEKIKKYLTKAGVSLPSQADWNKNDISEDEDGDVLPKVCQVGLYSATNPPGVEKISKTWCGEPCHISLAPKKTNQEEENVHRISENVVQVVHVCADHKKMAKLTKHIANVETLHKDARHKPKMLIFSNRIKTVKYIARELRESNKKATEIHGDKSQEERETAIRDFKGGKYNILVASDVAARGLHVKDLAYVVNYDFPSNLETYVHRVGRTGRVDAEGHAFSFFTRSLAPLAAPLIELLESHKQDIDPNLVKLAESYKIVEQKLKESGALPNKTKDGGERVRKNKVSKEDKVTITFDTDGHKREPFMHSKTFKGIKEGYYFSKGSKGLGYYLDAPRFQQKNKKKNSSKEKTPKKVQRMLPGKLARMNRRLGRPSSSSDDE